MSVLQVVYLLNALWFSAAFVQFSVAQQNTLKILVPREARQDPLIPTLSASVAFLGGMNLAIAAFCGLLVFTRTLFVDSKERAVLLVFLSLCNFSQFFFNVPVLLRGGRRGVALWPVLQGPMLKIFVIDGTLTLIDGVGAFLVWPA